MFIKICKLLAEEREKKLLCAADSGFENEISLQKTFLSTVWNLKHNRRKS